MPLCVWIEAEAIRTSAGPPQNGLLTDFSWGAVVAPVNRFSWDVFALPNQLHSSAVGSPKLIPNSVSNDWEEKMLTFRVADTKYDHGWCVLIRTMAFEVELKVDARLEIDEHENSSRHILCLDNENPCATARWRHYRPGIVKIERVAVLKSSRGRNIGSALMKHVMLDALANAANCFGFSLNAQEYAVSFHKRLGFRVIGEPFLDANIVNYTMERQRSHP